MNYPPCAPCPWWTFGDVIAIVFGLVGFGIGCYQWSTNRRDKTVEHLQDSRSRLDLLKNEASQEISKLVPYLQRGDLISSAAVELRILATTKFFQLYDLLEEVCSMIDYGVIDEKIVKDDFVPLLKSYAEAQVGWYKILKEIAQKTGQPFGTSQSSKTYQKFYRVVRKYLAFEERRKLNEDRKTCGLPSAFMD